MYCTLTHPPCTYILWKHELHNNLPLKRPSQMHLQEYEPNPSKSNKGRSYSTSVASPKASAIYVEAPGHYQKPLATICAQTAVVPPTYLMWEYTPYGLHECTVGPREVHSHQNVWQAHLVSVASSHCYLHTQLLSAAETTENDATQERDYHWITVHIMNMYIIELSRSNRKITPEWVLSVIKSVLWLKMPLEVKMSCDPQFPLRSKCLVTDKAPWGQNVLWLTKPLEVRMSFCNSPLAIVRIWLLNN